MQGTLIKEEFATSFFGITDPSASVTATFGFDSNDAVLLAAGSPVMLQSGAGFGQDAYLIPQSAISSLVFDLGSVTFGQADLVTTNLGTSGRPFALLLLGSMVPDGISTPHFSLDNQQGRLLFGQISCSLSCSIRNVVFGESYFEGAIADISSITVSTNMIDPTSVPEPSTLGLLGLGCAALGLVRRSRRH